MKIASLRYSFSQNSPIGSQHHLEIALAIINIEKSTPSAKVRKPDENSPNQHPPKEKDRTLNMKQGNHPWYRYCLLNVAWLPIQEAIAIERRKVPWKDKMTNYKFECLGTLPSEATVFCTFRQAFPYVAQNLYPDENPYPMVGQYLCFTQVPHHEKVNRETCLSKSYQTTI